MGTTENTTTPIANPWLRLEYPEPVKVKRGSRYDYGVGEGFDWIEALNGQGWGTVSGWARDGWDLGDWPYVVYSIKRSGEAWLVCEYVEGDLTIEAFDSRDKAHSRLDAALFFYTRPAREALLADIGDKAYLALQSVSDLPDRYRGPFSWARLEKETAK